ncbi:GtrA family protein [Lysobacter niastensis]|uniref:GtrA family protein n=1 Tax=Lysobacter niastensis TaxID=380629 RepID=A0ABS0BAG5_9GAMM|nr:GtrA family protein [Lysobacter niastensis]MBF6025974.1 GtrA family protein [Lysobacter niastensis]
MKRFIYFAIAGGIAAAANFGSRILLGNVFNYSTSIVIAYVIGMITAFLLNRAFVFPEGNEGIHKQAGWFIAVNMLAVLQTLGISLLLARVVFPSVGLDFHPETLAHAIGVIVPIFTSYLGHKTYTFRTR